MPAESQISNSTAELILPVAIIILAVSAIALFIYSGAGTAFYGVFLITAVVTLYTWYRLSKVQRGNAVGSEAAASAKQASSAGRATTKRRRSSKGRGSSGSS